jgi:hypothetical protein
VQVVEHERQRAPQALVQGLGQRRGEGVGARVLVGARVGGTRRRSASTRPRPSVESATSSGPSVYQAASWRCAQAASSVDLPTPAPAMTVVTRRLRA